MKNWGELKETPKRAFIKCYMGIGGESKFHHQVILFEKRGTERGMRISEETGRTDFKQSDERKVAGVK